MAQNCFHPSVEGAQHVQLALRAFRALQSDDKQATRDILKAKAEELARLKRLADLKWLGLTKFL